MDSIMRNKRMNILCNITKKLYDSYINKFGKEFEKFVDVDYAEKVLNEISEILKIENKFINDSVDDYEIDDMMYNHEVFIHNFAIDLLNDSNKCYENDKIQKNNEKESQKRFIEMSKSRKIRNPKKNVKKYNDDDNDSYDNYSDN